MVAGNHHMRYPPETLVYNFLGAFSRGWSMIGEMWGECAISALFGFVACKAETVNGVPRTMVGGVIFDSFGTEQWERWRGTVILIPKFIDVTRKPCGWRVSDLMEHGINRDVTDKEMKDPDSFWKPAWRPGDGR